MSNIKKTSKSAWPYVPPSNTAVTTATADTFIAHPGPSNQTAKGQPSVGRAPLGPANVDHGQTMKPAVTSTTTTTTSQDKPSPSNGSSLPLSQPLGTLRNSRLKAQSTTKTYFTPRSNNVANGSAPTISSNVPEVTPQPTTMHQQSHQPQPLQSTSQAHQQWPAQHRNHHPPHHPPTTSIPHPSSSVSPQQQIAVSIQPLADPSQLQPPPMSSLTHMTPTLTQQQSAPHSSMQPLPTTPIGVPIQANGLHTGGPQPIHIHPSQSVPIPRTGSPVMSTGPFVLQSHAQQAPLPPQLHPTSPSAIPPSTFPPKSVANMSFTEMTASSSAIRVTQLEQEVKQLHIQLNAQRSLSEGSVNSAEKRKLDNSEASGSKLSRTSLTTLPSCKSPNTIVMEKLPDSTMAAGKHMVWELGQEVQDAVYILLRSSISISPSTAAPLLLGQQVFRELSRLGTGSSGPQAIFYILIALLIVLVEGDTRSEPETNSSSPSLKNSAHPPLPSTAEVLQATLRVLCHLLCCLPSAVLCIWDDTDGNDQQQADAIPSTGAQAEQKEIRNPRLHLSPSSPASPTIDATALGSSAILDVSSSTNFIVTDENYTSLVAPPGRPHQGSSSDSTDVNLQVYRQWMDQKTSSQMDLDVDDAEVLLARDFVNRHSQNKSITGLPAVLLRCLEKYSLGTSDGHTTAQCEVLRLLLVAISVVITAPALSSITKQSFAYELLASEGLEHLLWLNSVNSAAAATVKSLVLQLLPVLFGCLGSRAEELLRMYSASASESFLDRLTFFLKQTMLADHDASPQDITLAKQGVCILSALMQHQSQFPLYLLRLDVSDMDGTQPLTNPKVKRDTKLRKGRLPMDGVNLITPDDVSESDQETKASSKNDQSEGKKKPEDQEEGDEERRERLRAKLLFNIVLFLRQALSMLQRYTLKGAGHNDLEPLERQYLLHHREQWGNFQDGGAEKYGRRRIAESVSLDDVWDDITCMQCPQGMSSLKQQQSAIPIAATEIDKRRSTHDLQIIVLEALQVVYILAQHTDLTKVELLRMDVFFIISHLRSSIETWQALGRAMSLDVLLMLECLEALNFVLYD